ncbi:unnamed protein product [Callosobruchus maculatus]|uniref:Uncharacterized protein n=1 Tax=Callosobruchus maculatus TaxID=64391 RepID=A0A653CQ65_CALMS|nr:unnamed protein product [Callosobruchus maculatus]
MEKPEEGPSKDETSSSLRNMIREILHQELKDIKSVSRSRSNSSKRFYRGGRSHSSSDSRSRSRSRSRLRRSRSPSVSRRRGRRARRNHWVRNRRSRSHSRPSRSRSPSVSRRQRDRHIHSGQNNLPPSGMQRQASLDGRSPRGAESQGQPGPDEAVLATNNLDDVLVLDEGDSMQLSEDTLHILGADPGKVSSSGFKLHNALASRWSHILTNGTPGEESSNLREKHAVPSNCGLLVPPKINPEVKAILSTTHLTRDSTHSGYQLHIGNGLTAMGKALNVILEEENNLPKDIRANILTNLTDSARIFATLFYDISNIRKYLISPVLNKSVKELTENTTPGEFLFGPDLGERAKSLKSLERAAQELRLPSTSVRNIPPPIRTFGQAGKRGGEQAHQRLQGL